MSLEDAIRDHGLDQSDADTLAWLAEAVTLRTDRTRYSWSGVLDKLDDAAGAGVLSLVETLKASQDDETRLKALAFDKALGVGVDFALDKTRSNLLSVRAGLPEAYQPLIDALLNIGMPQAPRYVRHGMQSLPTLEDIAAARAKCGNQDAVTALLNEVVNPMLAAGDSLADVKAAVAAWGA